MRKLRLVLVAVAFAAATLLSAAPAQAFCGPDEGCSPCPMEVVIDGKNSRIQWYYC